MGILVEDGLLSGLHGFKFSVQVRVEGGSLFEIESRVGLPGSESGGLLGFPHE